MVAFADVPPVVCPGLPLVDLLSVTLADVVHEKARTGGVWVEGHTEGVAKAPGERLLALLTQVGDTGRVASGAVHTLVRVVGGDSPLTGDTQYLSYQGMLIARSVVLSAAAGVTCVVTLAVASTDVKVAVLAEV